MESNLEQQNQLPIEDKNVSGQDDQPDDENDEIPIEDLEFNNQIDFERATLEDRKSVV